MMFCGKIKILNSIFFHSFSFIFFKHYSQELMFQLICTYPVGFYDYKQIVDPHTVDVDGKLYTAKNILISVGGRPFIPEISGSEYVIDSDAALDLPSRPKKIAIVGGGYIAVEFAGIFNGLKSEVHVFIRQKKVLRGFDEEVRGCSCFPCLLVSCNT